CNPTSSKFIHTWLRFGEIMRGSLSAELVMVVDSEKDAEKIKKDEPLYQSITVDELSNMKYEDIRALKISDIRKKVFENLKVELAKRKMATPYKDILVKKVVFQ
ncbi:flagellar basal body-associated FliL family protein, partial [Citrobacter freundii]|uniref:flagellar basal body-associated FliL family protein n=1 Tax=Citrobacter freundii TaxID=546 RepID=UPI0023B25E6A